jgi:hypothetical protein
MAEWLYEKGLGENRALLMDGGRAVEAHLEVFPAPLQPGDVLFMRVVEIQVQGRRGIVRLSAPGDAPDTNPDFEAILAPLPERTSLKSEVLVEIDREPIFDGRVHKRAKARPADPDAIPGGASALRDRIEATDHPIRTVDPYGPDLLEEAGWSEILEQAETGQMDFPGGSLSIIPTQAMTLIDVDGWLDADALALAAAKAAGRAIRLFGIGGSTVIDFPTMSNRDARKKVADAVMAGVGEGAEATAVNGFGLMQIIRPRPRRSLIELVRDDPTRRAAFALMRRAERSGLIGAVTITAAPAVVQALEAARAPDQLAPRLGGAVTLVADPKVALWGGHVSQTR